MKVSVIIPSYNCGPYLSNAISSVLQQTYKNFEIIVVDDGSTDNTGNIIEPFVDRIKFIKQVNLGVSAARNTGLKEATGDLIAFLDADDTWFPDKIAVQLNIINKHPDIIGIFSDFALCDKDGKMIHKRFVTRNYHIFNYYKYTWERIFPDHETVTFENDLDGTAFSVFYGDIFKSLYIGNFINTSSIVLKHEVLKTVGYFTPERRTQEDYEYWLKIASKYSFAYVDTPLLCTRRRPNQLTSKSEIFDIINQSLSIIENIGLNNIDRLGKDIVSRRLTDKYHKLALVHISRGNNKDARKYIRKSMKWNLFNYKSFFLLLLSFIPSTITGKVYRLLKNKQ
jgi:glycosyltransferase involved in cell wall biosynthesis